MLVQEGEGQEILFRRSINDCQPFLRFVQVQITQPFLFSPTKLLSKKNLLRQRVSKTDDHSLSVTEKENTSTGKPYVGIGETRVCFLIREKSGGAL